MTTQALSEALVFTLAHHLWQGVVLVLATTAILALASKPSGANRYRVWAFCFWLLVALPFATFLPRPALETGSPEAPPVVSKEPSRSEVPPVPPAETRVVSLTDSPAEKSHESASSPAVAAPIDWWSTLCLFWALGVIWQSVRLLRAGSVIRTSRREAEPVPADHPWAIWLEDQARGAYRGRVDLMTSSKIRAPMALGIRKPTILIPRGLFSSLKEDDMKRVLLHELAHLIRGDVAGNLRQKLAEALFWFHPALRWAGRQMNEGREIACDEWAASRTGRPDDYADSLVRVYKKSRGISSVPALATGAVKGPGQLGRRVDHLLALGNGTRKRSGVTTLFCLLLLGGGGVALAGITPRAAFPVLVVQANSGAKIQVEPLPEPHTADEGYKVGGRGSAWVHSNDDLHFELKGEVHFSEDETRVLSISPGGHFILRDKRGPDTEVRIEANRRGELEYRYRVDGSKRSFENEGARWLAQHLPVMLANSGLNGRERIQRIIDERGLEAAFAFIDDLYSEHGKAVYYRALVEMDVLDEGDFDRVLENVSTLTSDFERARIYRVMLENDRPPRVLARIADDLTELDSDYERQRVMAAMLDQRDIGEEVVAAMIRSAKTMESDYEVGRFMRRAAHQISGAGLIESGLMEIARGIESDYELARLLRTIAGQGDLDEKTVDDLLALAGETIDSDYELARVLRSMMPLIGDPIVYLEACKTIESDYERRRAMASLLEKHTLSDDALNTFLRLSMDLAGEERYRLLATIADRYDLEGESGQLFRESMRGLSNHRREQLERRFER